MSGQETYKVTLGLDKKYFMDGVKYSVISFDRMRIIDDDVELRPARYSGCQDKYRNG